MIPVVVKRKPTSKAATFRLTEEARRLLAELAETLGIDKTAALEIAIRETALNERAKRSAARPDQEGAG